MGFASNSATRPTGVGDAGSKANSMDYSGAVQLGTALDYGGISLQPAAGVRIATVSADSFYETGGGYVPLFAVNGAARHYTSVQPYVKLGISRIYVTGSQMAITPSASLGYDYEAGDRGRAATVATADGTQFTTGHINPDASTAELSAGIAAGRGNWSVYVRYAAYLSGNWTAQTGEGGLQVRF